MVHQSGGEWVTKFEILKGYINFADLASKTRDQEIIKYFISP